MKEASIEELFKDCYNRQLDREIKKRLRRYPWLRNLIDEISLAPYEVILACQKLVEERERKYGS